KGSERLRPPPPGLSSCGGPSYRHSPTLSSFPYAAIDIYPKVGILRAEAVQPPGGAAMARARGQKGGGRPPTVSEQLRAAIRAGGKTQSPVAKAAGLKPATVYRFVRRQRDVTGDTFSKLCKALGLVLAPAGESKE